MTISEDGCTAVTIASFGSVLADASDAISFHVRLQKFKHASVGYMGSKAFESGEDHGWFLLTDGNHHSNDSEQVVSYCSQLCEGDLVAGYFDKAAGMISFEVNGVNFGTAFRNVESDESLFPFVELEGLGATAFLEKPQRGIKR